MKTNSTYVRSAILMLLITVTFSADAQWGRRNYRFASSYYPVYGQRVMNLPGSFISINFGGNPYYYSNGAYYRPYGSSFRVAYPPFGLRINVLPRGYLPVYTGSYPYYYSNGIFYRQLSKSRDYEVIQAPLGAEIPSLPSEAKTMVIDGEKYYSFNGSYFKDVVKPNGELWFKVVGKNGVLNTYKNQETYPEEPQPAYRREAQPVYRQDAPRQEPQSTYGQEAQPQESQPVYRREQQPQQYPPDNTMKNSQPAAAPVITQTIPQNNGTREAIRRGSAPQEPAYDSTEYTAPDLILHDNPEIGWVVDRLPENSKAVYISNKKYFLAPNNTYYEEYVDNKRQVRYKVVGKNQ